jgi:aldehyde:ferredoxin oxidoreductase
MNTFGLNIKGKYHYEIPAINRGYAGQTLYINVDTAEITAKEVTNDMKEKFVGGRGFDLWLLWNAVNDDTSWDSPENEIVIASGPCGGITQYPGSGKSIAATISPLTNIVIDSNAGGHFGPYLKFAGWDAIELQGKAQQDVIIFINAPDGTISLLEAPSDCPADTHALGEWILKTICVGSVNREFVSFLSTGQGAENSRMGCLNFSLYDRKRQGLRFKQAGRGGIGTVFRDKRIKAVIVHTMPFDGSSNNPDDRPGISRVGAKMHKEISTFDPLQNRVGVVGTTFLVQIMNDYDLLPVHNYKYGSHPDAKKINSVFWEMRLTKNRVDGCWFGCTLACAHAVDGYRVKTGPYAGECVTVDGPEYETIAGVGSNCGIFDPEAILEMNFYCDTYGIDTISFGTSLAFVMDCFEVGILDIDKTSGLDLHFGNAEAAIDLLHQMAAGKGFGRIFGQGIRKMKQHFIEHFGADCDFLSDIGMEAKGLEYSMYITKESLAQQGGYGLTNKGPQHDEAWLIFMDQVNNQLPTFEDKAKALHYYPLWRTWFGLCGFCKLPWNDVVDPINAQSDEPAKVPHHVQNYVEIFEGVTGKKVTKEDLISMSERVYNFQRIFNIRLGYGLRKNDAIPYRSAGPVTAEEYNSRQERYDNQLREWLGVNPEKLSVTEKLDAHRSYRLDQYDKLIDAVYKVRGWTPNGVPTLETLKSLGIDYPDIVAVAHRYLE